ncbi:AraC family transcriptional regulator [Tichowtungia aerotolerans]|uniref:Substrate-binding domain-containing protein n=1 Tax=Tichowtungia aerotolerans TaxID=2697043 RepID=A0A6P1M2T4_9BACT|nr:DNA-binding transcriptional regulator [Tichowtungia aerotolerans]QHI69149.1 substrate-binding domain-containing protein [Tichowtungia aerotolerans]
MYLFHMMVESKKVAVVVPWHGYGQNILLGVSKYVHDHPDWVIHLVQSDSPVLEEDLRSWGPDGVISGMVDLPSGMQDQRYSLPWVSVLAQPDDETVPFVTIDEDAVGRMAADYFINRRFRHFAYLGNEEHEFSLQRADAFEYALKEKGIDCHTLLYPTKVYGIDKRKRTSIDRQKAKWLAALPKPVALFACNDWEAFQFVQFCRQQGVRIPEDVAILGVGNDELLCNVSQPPMSSIRMPFEKVGYDAAALLDRLLEKTAEKEVKHFLPPAGMVSRQSTDVMQVSDATVAKALSFIQDHIQEPIKVEDLLKHVYISRTLLERKFKVELGHTPLVEIRRQRIRRARQLLADTNLSVAEIAEACGFSSDIRLSTVFKELTGQSPSAFRKAVKAPSSVHEL